MKRKRKETPLRIDATTEACLLNRYVALCTYTRYYAHGTLAQNVPMYTQKFLQIQWQNIKRDIRGFFRNPFVMSPAIAWSLVALLFILLKKYDTAQYTAFVIGAVSYDNATADNHTGEPATITISHTVNSGSDRLVTIQYSGLAGSITSTWAGNATTNAYDQGTVLRCDYYIAPSTGASNAVLSGGNIKVGGVISFFGADQTTPIGNTTTNGGASSPATISLTTTAADSFRIDTFSGLNDNSTTPSGSADTGTSRYSSTVQQNQFQCLLRSYTDPKPTAGSTDTIWTVSAITRRYGAVEIKASTGAAATPKSLPLTGAGAG